MKKKLLSLVLASAMVLSITACGSSASSEGVGSTAATEEATEAVEEAAEETAEATEEVAEETEAAGDFKIAMITDSGDITDMSFNQTTYEACKTFAEANGLEFTYKKPDGDTDDARIAMVDAAVAEGYNVIVMPGYLFAATIVEETPKYPDVNFIALDMSAGDLLSAALGDQYDWNPDNWNVGDYYNTSNTYCAIYQEELPGFMAGYAAVKMGYTKLGFLGGMAVPAVIRYGYGFVQGANYAAEELGNTADVEIEYAYGGQFFGSSEITAVCDTWCSNGTEVIFACGGGIFTSAAEAAAKVDAKIIGVDVDQAGTIDAYGEGMTITSAMKGLAATVNTSLQAVVDGTFSSMVGKIDNLGLVSGDDLSLNYVAIAGSTQYNDTFTEDDYKALVSKMFNGEITVSNAIDADPEVGIKVNYREGTIM